ncbi:hypothetical protein LSTR_LSTR010365 [Laodelphax striatellus]|uniref:Uncharacterized protein n=1 Tax=Laodelphax striatellus TaxID=195883 RepID=A0A482WJV5_LAOST|nr:hypothetical protein LSTR_LSTR010365 [Laodelphax striatellus]
MEGATSFSMLQKCSIIPKAMKCARLKSRDLLFVWSFQEVYVYEFKLTVVDGLPEFNEFEETFNFVNGVLAVISKEENVYALDKKGSVFVLDLSEKCSGSVDDMDIFEASPEEENCGQNFIGNLDKCDQLLAALEVEGGFATCSECEEKMFVKIWKMDPLEKISEHCIVTDSSPSEVFLSYNEVPILVELKRKHFNFLQEDEHNVLVVGLSSGQIHCISCSRRYQSNIFTILSTPYSISSVNWIVDEARHISTALLVQFQHGAAMLLHENGSQTLYLAGPVYTSLFDSTCMTYATTDGIDCVLTKLQLKDEEECKYECSISPLKGIRSMCKLPNTSLVLVGTQHKCIYWLNVCVPPAGDPAEFEMPEDRLLDALLASTVCLENICLQMENEDAIIRAVALVKRAERMGQYFSILAKVYAASRQPTDRIKVRVETSCDFVDFSSQVWRLELTVVSPQGGRTEVILKKLTNSFNCDNPLVCEMETGSIVIGSEVRCCMLASIETDQPWLAFPIGKIKIDAGYLLNVVNHAPKSMGGDSSSKSILSPSETNQQVDMVLTLTLSPSVLDDELLFPKIFFNSSHRMLKEQWLSLKGGSIVFRSGETKDGLGPKKFEKFQRTNKKYQ